VCTIPCECGCVELEIKKHDWRDGDEPLYMIEFKVSAFYAGQSLIHIIKQRLKFAWLALRKGNYYFQDIVANKELLAELRDNLTEFLDSQ
jgi:hypothetical protein